MPRTTTTTTPTSAAAAETMTTATATTAAAAAAAASARLGDTPLRSPSPLHRDLAVGPSLWMDDLEGRPPMAAVASSSLEDSLHFLQQASGSPADPTFEATDEDDVHALFPMLSESSFDYDEDDAAGLAGLADTGDSAFPDDLSPIFTAGTAMSLSIDPVLLSPLPRRKRLKGHTPRAVGSSPMTPSRLRRSCSPAPGSMLPRTAAPALPMLSASPSPLRRKRRRPREMNLALLRPMWSEHEQIIFFAAFKAKWPQSTAPFDDQLAARAAAVSDKLKTKSPEDVRRFYDAVLGHVTELLQVASPTHDIDLTNADEVRIALWCWSKLAMDVAHKDEFLCDDAISVETKGRLAMLLLQSIIRSRRQMLKNAKKAQSLTAPPPTTTAPPGPPVPEDLELPFVSIEGLLRDALEHASLPAPAPPVTTNPVIHHPNVRKKVSATIATHALSSSGTMKRKRSESVETNRTITTTTTTNPSMTATPPGPMNAFVALPGDDRTPLKAARSARTQTPPQSTRKKIYIKFRMVPRDVCTRQCLEKVGCNPKVELKLSSTKKVADVLDHMTKKWARAQPLFPKDSTLHFFQRDAKSVDATKSCCWSRRNDQVTCLDVWKQCGRTKNDEYIVVVAYQWHVLAEVGGPTSNGSQATSFPWAEDSKDLLDLFGDDDGTRRLDFEQDVSESPSSTPSKEVPSSTIEPAPESDIFVGSSQSLQAFGEAMAFDPTVLKKAKLATATSELTAIPFPEDEPVECSPNSLRMRRRITPVLVQTKECQL